MTCVLNSTCASMRVSSGLCLQGGHRGVNANQAGCLTGPSQHRQILEQQKHYQCVETNQNKVVYYPL